MLRLDPNNPLDCMILHELNDQPVLFDEWLDAMDELADEPDCDQILQERGLRKEEILREASAYRENFRARLAARGLPVSDRFALCRLFCEQAQASPSGELLQIYCEILCDPGFLLDDPTNCEEQLVFQYLSFLPERDELLQILLQRRELAGKFVEVQKRKRSPKPVDCVTEQKHEVVQVFKDLFDLPANGDGYTLLNNLEHYIQLAAADPVLKSVEPLLLFRLLTRRQSYMCSVPELSVDLSAIWKRDSGNVETNNGKNFKQYHLYLRFFDKLCKVYEKDTDVNLPLCWYGLEQITVLGDFYWCQMADIMIERLSDLPFLPPIEELVENALFSCFEHGYGDNLLLTESGLSCEELTAFQCSENSRICSTLERLSDYMNDHAAELTERFLQAGPAEVRSLCRSILENAKLRYTVAEEKLPLYLASINGGLMELQDYFASQYLIQAGQALTAYGNSSTD